MENLILNILEELKKRGHRFSFIFIGGGIIYHDSYETKFRNEIKKRITERLKKRLDEEMIEEVKKLLQMGISNEKLAFFGLEYKYIALYLTEELNYNDMFQKLNSAIHNFAKRQMTWFRKMEREGVEINWFDGGDFEVILKFIEKRIDYDTKSA